MTYAKIENDIVENLIEIAHNTDDFPECVPVDDRPVQIGDAYQDGAFYRAGEMVKGVLDLLADAQAENQEAFAILRGEV